MNEMYTQSRPNPAGCCLIGMILAVFYGIWRLIAGVVRIIWRGVPYFFRFMYYFYAWPLLLFEYLWKRGGVYRILSIGVMVVLVVVFASALLRNNTPVSPISAEAALSRTASPTAKRSGNNTQTRTATPRKATMTRSATRMATRTTIPSATRTTIPSATPIPTAPSTNGEQFTRPANIIAAEVIRVIDGDTVVVDIDGEEERLRLIGIDTPESVDPRKPVQCFGIEASNYTKRLLTNQTIYLEQDRSQGETDAYNRLLVYVWLDERTLFNYTIIADGYAFEYTYRLPYRYQAQFKRAQQQARSNNNGLWAPNTCNGNVDTSVTVVSTQEPTNTVIPTATMTASERAFPCQVGQIKGNPNSMIYHVPTGQSYAQTRNSRVVCFDSEAAATAAGYRKASR